MEATTGDRMPPSTASASASTTTTTSTTTSSSSTGDDDALPPSTTPSAAAAAAPEQQSSALQLVTLSDDDRRWLQLPLTERERPEACERWPIFRSSRTRCSACVDKQSLASVACLETTCAFHDQAVCTTCFREQHPTEEDQWHRLRPCNACPQCHDNDMEVWCIDCDLSFCAECFDAIHNDVRRATRHRRVSMEGTPGTLFIRSNWSTRFLGAVNALRKNDPATADVPLPSDLQDSSISDLGVQTAEFVEKIEATDERIQPTEMKSDASATTSPSVGDKRKRDEAPAEVICVDEDDSDDSRETTTLVSLGTVSEAGFTGPPPPTSEAVPLPGDMPRLTIPEPTVYPPPRASTPNAPSGYVGTTQSFNGHTTFSTPSTQQFGIHTSLTPRYSDASNQHVKMSMSAPMTTHASNVLPPTSMPMTNGQPLPTPRASAVIAGLVDNPLEEAMYEQLDRVSSSITQTEQTIVQLNAQIVRASYHNIQAAQKLVSQLQEQQARLEQLKSRRDLAVVHLIIQSKSIIAKVKLLRVDLLGDIPQVQVASFQKCLQASAQLQQATASFATLNSRMAMTLETMGTVSTEVFHRSVSSINDAIQSTERLVAALKLERENEIVRVVQYSARIRDMLKRAVTLQQRQRQQQQQVRRQQQGQQQQHHPQQQQARATHQAPDPRSSQQTMSHDISQEINRMFDQLNNCSNQQQ